MEIINLRMYFKASVLPPFFLACFAALLFCMATSSEPETQNILKGNLYSGLVGICSFSIFLNHNPSIANHPIKRALAWFLIPCLFILVMIITQIDWKHFGVNKPEQQKLAIYYLAISMFHLIGLGISFVDFRNSMILRAKHRIP